jgi:hypothetical protein
LGYEKVVKELNSSGLCCRDNLHRIYQ